MNVSNESEAAEHGNYRRNQGEDGEETTIDESREVLEDNNRADGSTSEKQTGAILQGRDSINTEERRVSQADRGRYSLLEKRTIQETVEDSKFEKLSRFVTDEISNTKNKELYVKYFDDTRWDDGYGFAQMVTYDMLTDPNNELRELLAE